MTVGDRRDEAEKEMVILGNQNGQSALSDSIKKQVEADRHNMSYDMNYLNKDFLYP